MHNHACGLVYNDQVVVLKNNVERNILWLNVTIHRLFHGDLDLRAFSDLGFRIGLDGAVDRNSACLKQLRDARA